MTGRERINLALAHREPDRVPNYDSVWPTTLDRWREEGLPAGRPLDDLFGWDLAAIGFDQTFGLEPEVIETTDTWIVARDGWGTVTRRWKGRESVPEYLSYGVPDRARWEELKPAFAPREDRVNWEAARRGYEAQRAAGRWIGLSGSFGFQLIMSRIVGPVVTLTAMAAEPEWVREMVDAVAELTIGMGEILLGAGFELDGAHLADDLSYRNGPFMSPTMYRELIQPAHRRICDFCRGRGLPVIHHCCGDVRRLIPDLLDAGIAGLNPLEVKAGMDLLALKREYGERLTLIGGIDVRTWASGDRAAIEAEIAEKVTFAKRGGGYLFHSDHSIPDNVDYATYLFVLDRLAAYGGA